MIENAWNTILHLNSCVTHHVVSVHYNTYYTVYIRTYVRFYMYGKYNKPVTCMRMARVPFLEYVYALYCKQTKTP